jgi:hypothetical protein
LIGTDQYITEVRSPIVAAGFERRVVGSAAAAEARDLGALDRFDRDPELAVRAGRVEEADPTLDYVLDLAPSWDEFAAGLKRNIRESIRHCYNSLKRDGFHARAEVVQGAEIRRGPMSRLHAARADWATPSSTLIVCLVDARAFCSTCQRWPSDVARVYLLKISGDRGDAPPSVGETLYLYYSGFDPKWRGTCDDHARHRGCRTPSSASSLVNCPPARTCRRRAGGAAGRSPRPCSCARARPASRPLQTARTADTITPARAIPRSAPRRDARRSADAAES